MRSSPQNFSEETSLVTFTYNCSDWFSELTTLHGYNWIHRVRSRWAKSGLLSCVSAVLYTTIIMLVWDGLQFAKDKSIQSREVSMPEFELKYPQFMVCHPFYFKRDNFLGNLT